MTPLGRTKDLPFSGESLDIVKGSHRAFDGLDRQAIKSWDLYKEAGKGFVEIRKLAMLQACTNRPYGTIYTAAYAKLLAASKLDERMKDKGDRQKLVAVMDNLLAIEEWMGKLSKEDRRRWTHPTTIYKRWQASLVPPRKYDGQAPATSKRVIEEAMTDTLDALRNENSQLKVKTQHSIDLHHAPLDELEQWFEAGCLQKDREDWLRDLLNRRHARRQPLPRRVVATTSDMTDDDVGLPPVRFPDSHADDE